MMVAPTPSRELQCPHRQHSVLVRATNGALRRHVRCTDRGELTGPAIGGEHDPYNRVGSTNAPRRSRTRPTQRSPLHAANASQHLTQRADRVAPTIRRVVSGSPQEPESDFGAWAYRARGGGQTKPAPVYAWVGKVM